MPVTVVTLESLIQQLNGALTKTEPTLIAVCLSGGIDSTTALAMIMKQYPVNHSTSVVGVLFRYPSKHNELELAAARNIAIYYGIKTIVVDLTQVFNTFTNNSITGKESIPEGNYTDESMKSTVVPLRNVIFASIAGARLLDTFPTQERILLTLGVHSGDHPIYPDCRPETVAALDDVLYHGTGGKIHIGAPFTNFNKTDIIEEGLRLGVPYHLTRTCYTDNPVACGKCGSCVERLEAFEQTDTEDPAHYALTGL